GAKSIRNSLSSTKSSGYPQRHASIAVSRLIASPAGLQTGSPRRSCSIRGTELDGKPGPTMALRTLPKVLIGLFLIASLANVGQKALGLEAQDVLYFRAGPLTLRPQVGISEVYNDNVFYLAKSPVSDFITAISPGLKLQLGRPQENYL